MVSSTTSPTATTSIATLLGAGSGIDMLDLANKLAEAQFAGRNQRIDDQTEKLKAQISAASDIKSMLLGLDTSLGALVRTGDLARNPSVGNSTVASATLSGSSQPSGSFSLEVTQIAAGQRIASGAYASPTATVGSGSLKLRFGTVSGTSFTEDTAHAAVDITVPAGATLNDVAAAINGAKSGVTAYVAQTVDGAQLVLRGADGEANGFVLEATENAGDPGLSGLAWNPASGTGLLSAATDAKFKIDGLDYSSKTNTVTDAIPGVKLTLTGTNAGAPTKVSFADPTSSIASAMQEFTDALNEVVSALNSATAIGGDLANDSGARALKRSLSQLAGQVIMPNATGNARTLADLGLSTQRDGTLSLDTKRLDATIASDPDGVAAMFTNGIYGVYATFDKIYRDASSTQSNSIGASVNRYNKELTQLVTDKADLADDQEKLRASMAKRFTASETRIGQSKATLSLLENQIAQWNKSDS